jgi:hypothetical protein
MEFSTVSNYLTFCFTMLYTHSCAHVIKCFGGMEL